MGRGRQAGLGKNAVWGSEAIAPASWVPTPYPTPLPWLTLHGCLPSTLWPLPSDSSHPTRPHPSPPSPQAFAMTGWRLGYLAAPQHFANAAAAIQSQSTSGGRQDAGTLHETRRPASWLQANQGQTSAAGPVDCRQSVHLEGCAHVHPAHCMRAMHAQPAHIAIRASAWHTCGPPKSMHQPAAGWCGPHPHLPTQQQLPHTA